VWHSTLCWNLTRQGNELRGRRGAQFLRETEEIYI
jgi:hypothetical protein